MRKRKDRQPETIIIAVTLVGVPVFGLAGYFLTDAAHTVLFVFLELSAGLLCYVWQWVHKQGKTLEDQIGGLAIERLDVLIDLLNPDIAKKLINAIHDHIKVIKDTTSKAENRQVWAVAVGPYLETHAAILADYTFVTDNRGYAQILLDVIDFHKKEYGNQLAMFDFTTVPPAAWYLADELERFYKGRGDETLLFKNLTSFGETLDRLRGHVTHIKDQLVARIWYDPPDSSGKRLERPYEYSSAGQTVSCREKYVGELHTAPALARYLGTAEPALKELFGFNPKHDEAEWGTDFFFLGQVQAAGRLRTAIARASEDAAQWSAIVEAIHKNVLWFCVISSNFNIFKAEVTVQVRSWTPRNGAPPSVAGGIRRLLGQSKPVP